ncbi:hypothetical protein BH11MYX1_BH11MYX1_42080 [soil metagenome]
MFNAHQIRVSDKTVGKLLHQLGYSLQAAMKAVEGKQHPERDAQFEHIAEAAKHCVEHGVPFISVDTKKNELVGNVRNARVEWQPKDSPELVGVHDFPNDALGKAIPYGVYDVADNSGFVNVGIDHYTPVFAVTSIETWWKRMGSKRYPNATQVFITADAGGRNGDRARVWKFELQRLADKLRLPIHVSHFPPGTSKWNKGDHRLFSFITMNWYSYPAEGATELSLAVLLEELPVGDDDALRLPFRHSLERPARDVVMAEESEANVTRRLASGAHTPPTRISIRSKNVSFCGSKFSIRSAMTRVREARWKNSTSWRTRLP